ncbi:adenylosuccinate synthase [Thalassoglobus polymorphus]|uniref:Adenylosuccinate synthetase n=1 Tax=Thalassoglobus polymorphus TaxID=2527994 RepID=A0A517QHC8_9PLAN|nr:adenylosuccinate synthase [Thalassoglobus polymorphus]QDT31015.1 Adenylosuccinate synthetase [Thalassoglobus polymorphus]
MAVTAVVGLQWGDEAKGKIVDILADQHEIVVRYLGGNNAGHTVMFGGETYKLSLLPSGILRPDATSVIANGVVIDPKALLGEIASIKSQGVQLGKLFISDKAHVIFPYHVAEEAILEARRGDQAIGTTMRGIGTCYRDKIGRAHAIRIGDLLRPELFREKLEDIVEAKNIILKAFDPSVSLPSVQEIYDEYLGYIEQLKDSVIDTTSYLHRELKNGSSMLFEGAQGSLLDIDHGTFPYVTSSNSSGCGIQAGSGIPSRMIDRVIGVVKAYTTRVGGGPCPTELEDETGQHIRDEGNEYGTVTGRPRRCGWFDAVATAHGARVSGIDCIAVMLLDVLSKLDEVKICEAYEIHGERTTDFPSQLDDLAAAKPIYRTLPGWKTDITNVRRLEDFPKEARHYIDSVSELLESEVGFVSIGPDREQTVIL